MKRIRNTVRHDADVAIGAALKRRRLALRLTMADVAREAGWIYQKVQRYESGEVRISFSSLTEISRVLRTTADEISAEANGTRPYFGATVERSLLRVTARLAKIPEHRREDAVRAVLETLDTYRDALPDGDEED